MKISKGNLTIDIYTDPDDTTINIEMYEDDKFFDEFQLDKKDAKLIAEALAQYFGWKVEKE